MVSKPQAEITDMQFAQNSLQDYVDCPRRFQLRHLLKVAWPAIRAEPIAEMERRARLGQRFHRMVQQYFLGVSIERLERGIDDEDLRRWWHNFLSAPPRDLPTVIRRVEVSLSAPLDSCRLTARYDLLAADAGKRQVIVDWKTHRPKDPQRLREKLQSVVYPYVLVEAGAAFNGGQPVRPEQVAMVYWFADLPNDPLQLDYDATRHAANNDRLMALVREIETYCAEGMETWPLTDFSHNCKFCTYRSLCNRGSAAGDLDDLDEELEIEELSDIDLGQVAEIVFQ